METTGKDTSLIGRMMDVPDPINCVFQMLDPEQFHRAFFPVDQWCCGKNTGGIVSTDGKPCVEAVRKPAARVRCM